MKKIWEDFKKFAIKGNAVDLAVGDQDTAEGRNRIGRQRINVRLFDSAA